MSLFRVLSGSVKKGDAWHATGSDVELTADEAARLNKNGRKTVEPTDVALARTKAEADKKKAVDDAEKKAKADADKAKAEEEAKKKGAAK
jgi:membrane protein involved in colicin uptake